MRARTEHLEGRRFGRLVARKYRPGCGRRGGPRLLPGYFCDCDCGTTHHFVTTSSLIHPTEGTRSCRCLQRELLIKRSRTHGAARSRLYAVWNMMKARCLNPRNHKYPRYGGRGIRVCRRWRGDFAAFRADVGDRPTRAHSLDRIDNDGHYSCGKCAECRRNGWPKNVRWATAEEQMRNRDYAKHLTHDGLTLTPPEWSERTRLPVRLIYARLASGWPVAKVLTQPYRKPTGRTPARELLYATWTNMRRRCFDPRGERYPDYGGRGITVCDRWLGPDGFAHFLADMGPRPSPKHSLDRRDVDGNYGPGNCRWATPEVQRANKRVRVPPR